MTDVVLYSGGVESTYCMLMSPPDSVCVMFDYGQPYAELERSVVQANHRRKLFVYDEKWFTEKEHEQCKWLYRNEIMISVAVRELRAKRVWFGCRAPLYAFDRYNDSNRQFCNRLEKELGIEIVTPALMLPKWLIMRRIRKLDPGIGMYSSEAWH